MQYYVDYQYFMLIFTGIFVKMQPLFSLWVDGSTACATEIEESI